MHESADTLVARVEMDVAEVKLDASDDEKAGTRGGR